MFRLQKEFTVQYDCLYFFTPPPVLVQTVKGVMFSILADFLFSHLILLCNIYKVTNSTGENSATEE